MRLQTQTTLALVGLVWGPVFGQNNLLLRNVRTTAEIKAVHQPCAGQRVVQVHTGPTMKVQFKNLPIWEFTP